MNKLGNRNSVNVNIAIHMPNPSKKFNSTGLTIDKVQVVGEEDDAANLSSNPSAVRLNDVVEISPTARKLVERRHQASRG